MKNALLLALAGFVAGSSWVGMPVQARDQFKKAFDKKYLKPDSTEKADQDLVAAVKTANCNLCHVGPNPKVGTKNRNEYGKAYGALVKTKDVGDAGKMAAAFDTISETKSNPDDPASPTYGDLIKQGKLPVVNPPIEAAAK